MVEPHDDRLRRALAPLPRERTMLLPALLAVQRELRFLPLWAIEQVGRHVRVPKSEVYGVATHFPLLRLEEPGETVVKVCTGVSCRVNGAGKLLAELQAALGVELGGTAADGSVTLEETACAFLCSVAPVVEIEGCGCGRATVERVLALIRERTAEERNGEAVA
ncbi:MAG: NAD(P)H-dependent oxidoreductase subunit E [Chloroflexi bacterium]|nr:NAD(P)H-dependent oxidoreductase subunit E [Chloroflexota bacterium]